MIITSLLDLDFYKLSQGQFIFSKYGNVIADYKMTVRNGKEIDYWKYVRREEFAEEIRALKDLSLTEKEADYLRSLGYFAEEYIAFLSNKPMSESVVSWDGDTLETIFPKVSGKWANVMLYEIFCLAIGNELFARNYARFNQIDILAVENTARRRFHKKADSLDYYNSTLGKPVNLVEFGTRRRLSHDWQRYIVRHLKDTKLVTGTSNVYFAREFGLKPIGTQAHELIMGYQALGRVQDSQKTFFYDWLEFYNGKLAMALSDTLGTKKFLRDFNGNLANRYDGLRHDSGDPTEWGDKMIDMYVRFGIHPNMKTLLFSDGLDFEKMIELHKKFSPKINVAFGIGTNLTNDTFLPVPQAVMKLQFCNGQPCAKLSNNPAKATCPSAEYLEYVKYVAKEL